VEGGLIRVVSSGGLW